MHLKQIRHTCMPIVFCMFVLHVMSWKSVSYALQTHVSKIGNLKAVSIIF